MTKVIVTTDLRPSENETKVLLAISNFFIYENVRKQKGENYFETVICESETLRSLEKFHKALRDERILDAARKYLRKGMSRNSITFMLHKQAAAVGVISFVDDEKESPLGPIIVYIEHRNPEEVIDWLAPKTSKGAPLWENEVPDD